MGTRLHVEIGNNTDAGALNVDSMDFLLPTSTPHVQHLQAASGFFGNLKDALFLLGQTTAPPSVRVIARQFCREYMVGEYFLVDGAQAGCCFKKGGTITNGARVRPAT